MEKAFINGLRTASSLLAAFAHELEHGDEVLEKAGKPLFVRLQDSFWAALSRDRMRKRLGPLRNTMTWLVALQWSSYRGYSGTCVTAASFLFSPSLGKLYERNVQRILGVGLGLVLGGLPQILLMNPDAKCGKRLCFKAEPQGSILYFELMFLLWTASIYGMLATGGKSAYACCLWAGFGGTMMLGALVTATEKINAKATEASLYNQTMDNVLACLLVFVVDTIFSKMLHSLPTEYAGQLVYQSFDEVSVLVDRLGDCDFQGAKVHLDRLKVLISDARTADAEVQKADHTWSSVHLAPYKGDMVRALLDHLDNIYVTSWSVLATSERLGEASDYKAMVQKVLPDDLINQSKLYAIAIGAAVLEQRGATIQDLVAQGKLPNLAGKGSMERWTELATEQPSLSREHSLDPSIADQAPVTSQVSKGSQNGSPQRNQRSPTRSPGSIERQTSPGDQGGCCCSPLSASRAASAAATRAAAFAPMTKAATLAAAKRSKTMAMLVDPGKGVLSSDAVQLESRVQAVVEDLSGLNASKEAATTSLVFNYWNLCLHLFKVGALLQEHAYWASAEWRPTTEEAEAAVEGLGEAGETFVSEAPSRGPSHGPDRFEDKSLAPPRFEIDAILYTMTKNNFTF